MLIDITPLCHTLDPRVVQSNQVMRLEGLTVFNGIQMSQHNRSLHIIFDLEKLSPQSLLAMETVIQDV